MDEVHLFSFALNTVTIGFISDLTDPNYHFILILTATPGVIMTIGFDVYCLYHGVVKRDVRPNSQEQSQSHGGSSIIHQ